MTDYVLEILDGDNAGDIVELTGEPVTIGRRSGSTIVLKDEKVSGKHAEITREADGFLLKDLDSTNGSFMDGRRITEVALTPNDIVRFGRIRVAFKEKGAPTPGGEDMRLRRVDAATLARGGRRGAGIGLLLLLVVGLAGFGFWYSRTGPKVRGGGVTKAPERVAGNLLPDGVDNIEADNLDGWKLDISGVAFDAGGQRHTGASALQAVFLVPEEGAASDKLSYHGLARTAEPIRVVSGQALIVSGWLLTEGDAKAALRARFSSSDKERDKLIITAGLPPAAYDKYTRAELPLAVPSGMDQVQVEVLALLPNDSSRVSADDFAVVPGGDQKPLELRTGRGQDLIGTRAGVAIRSPESDILLGIVPLVKDVGLRGLSQAGLLGLSDAGLELSITGSKKGYALEVIGKDPGVRLDFAGEVGASGVLVRQGDAPFVGHAEAFKVDEADRILLGQGLSRLMVVLIPAGPVQGALKDGVYQLRLPGTSNFHIVTGFSTEAERARTAVHNATRAQQQGNYDLALNLLDEVLQQFPHDDREASKARQLRAQLRLEQNQWLDRLQVAFDDARFFGTRGGFERVRDELDHLQKKYGDSHITQKERFEKMRQDADVALTRLQRQRSQAERANLESLVEVFGATKQKSLQELVSRYIKDYLPSKAADASKDAGNNASKDAPQKTKKSTGGGSGGSRDGGSRSDSGSRKDSGGRKDSGSRKEDN